MASNPEPAEIVVPATDTKSVPIIIDLGRHRRKQIKRLREGTGKLLDEVLQSIHELKTAGRISESAQPVVVVVREKKKARNWMLPKL